MEIDYQTAIKAGYSVLAVKTAEPLRFTATAARMNGGRRLTVWDVVRGYQTIGEKGYTLAEDPFAIPDMAAGTQQTTWILNNFHFWLKEPGVIQAILNNIPAYQAQRVTLIILCPDLEIPLELSREITVIDFSLPNRDALAEILDGMTTAQKITLDPATRETILDALQGLTWQEASDALAYSLVSKRALDPATITTLKAQMVMKSASLQFSQYAETFENLGGLDEMKSWHLNRFKNRRPGLPFRGSLVLGSPGNGKSHFAKALGRETGWPVLSLDMGKVFGSLVGESEAKMRGTLQVIDAMAPCVVFIDEIEKALSGVGGQSTDGGTSQRVGATFLSWLQDHTSEVFVIATCNDIKSLSAASDGAFVRAGRWDITFYVDNPDPDGARKILDIYTRQYLSKPLADFENVPALAGYSGAEIRQVAIEAAYNGGDLTAAAADVIPLSKSNKDRLDALRQWAEGRTKPATNTATSPQANPLDFARAVAWKE